MPTYSYQCKRCNHIEDIFHSMSATPVVKCAQCGGRCTKLLGTGAGIIFKGSGFYETDYKKKGKAPASDSSGGKSTSETTASPAGKTEKSPASSESKSTAGAKTD